MDCSPGGPRRPEPPLLPSLSGLWSREGHVGRGLHTVLVRRRAPPPSLVRPLLRHAGVGSPCGRDPRGSRHLGALGRAVCRSTRIPPPPASSSLLGGGGASPWPRGGRGPLLWLPGWGVERGGRVGGLPPRPPAPSGIGLPSVVFGVPPRGIVVPWGLTGGRQRVSAAGGGGEGEGSPPPCFAPPSLPGRPLIGPLHLRRPGRRRSTVGRQRAGRAGACLGRGAPAPRVQRPLRGRCGAAVSSVCHRPLLGLSGRGGEWGGPSGPLAPPPDGRGGGGMAVLAPGASHRLGGRTLPPPPSI